MSHWYEFIEAKTILPVFILHFTQRYYTKHQSCIGMIHALISYLMHFSFWWLKEEEGEWIKLCFYIADKCFILIMMWGFHYHLEPYSAKIVVLPIGWNISQIILYQPYYFLQTRLAYFDVISLLYLLIVSLVFLFFMKNYQRIGTCILLLSSLGYGMRISGLMHLMLVPGFWLCYEEIKLKQLTKQEKKIITNKKDHEL